MCEALQHHIQSALHIHRVNQLQIENIWGGERVSECSKKQNLNLPHAGNYLHSIYIVSGLISNLQII